MILKYSTIFNLPRISKFGHAVWCLLDEKLDPCTCSKSFTFCASGSMLKASFPRHAVFASKGSTAPLHCCTCAFTKLHCMPVTCQECCDMRSCHQLCHLCVVAMGLFVHSLQDVNDLASCCIGCCQSCTHWCSIDVTWFNSPEFAMLLLSSIRLRQLGRAYGVLDHILWRETIS